MRVRFGVLLAAIGGTLSFGAVEASAALEFCERASDDRGCARITVPLDHSGVVPGGIKLRVERQMAKRATRPPVFLIAGGPGQSAIDAFSSFTIREFFGTETRSRDIVVMDQRGTGRSGVLDCPVVQRGSSRVGDIAACAAKLGSRRDFYSSAYMAEDIDMVRVALGAPKIAIYGVSYGTHVALTYARRHADKVDRLVLDSVVGPRGVDAFERPSMAATPRVANGICGKRLCRSFTRDAGNDMTRLAARLDSQPLVGQVTDRGGRRHRARIDGRGLLDLTAASDLNPFLAAEIPAAVHNALRGDAAPLLRARRHAAGSEAPPESPRDLSVAAYLATLCSDTLLPWESGTRLDARREAASTLVGSLGPNAFAPFGARTALNSDVLEACRSWPSPMSRGDAAPVIGQLPDVPALLLAGGLDVRTPVESARAVAAEMPRAKVMVVGHAGHGVLGWDLTSCPSRATRRFLAGGDPGRCGPGPRATWPFPAMPIALSELPPSGGASGRAGRTASALQYTFGDYLIGTFGDLFARLVRTDGDFFFEGPRAPVRIGALRGGSYVDPPRREGVIFRRAVAIPGVRVDGALIWRGRRRGTTGFLRISGSAAAHGRLVVRRDALRGKLGGRRVRIPANGLAGLFGRSSAVGSSATIAQIARMNSSALRR